MTTVQFEAHPLIPNLNVLPLKALVKELTENREAVQRDLKGRLPILGFPGIEGEDWWEYVERVFGDIAEYVWDYMFSASWPNDIDHALIRLNDVLGGRESTLPSIVDLNSRDALDYSDYIESLKLKS